MEEAVAARAKFSSSVTLRVSNFLSAPLTAVRTTARAGEMELPQCDVAALGRESLLCRRVPRPAAK